MKILIRVAVALALVLVVFVGFVSVRHLVFWNKTELVRFESDEISLAGTLVFPGESGPRPAVIFLHGSGPEPRYDAPSRAIMNALVRAGFAVLVYDKRGVGESEGIFETAVYADFINDGIAAVEYLAARPEIDPVNIGLYTVSESGSIAPEIALRSGRIRFIFNKVGSPINWLDTVAWEIRNEFLEAGVATEDVGELVSHTVKRWQHYIAVAADPELISSAQRHALDVELQELRLRVNGAMNSLPETLWDYDADSYNRFAANASYSPTPFLDQLDIPMYYAYGGADVIIPTKACVEFIRDHMQLRGKNVQVKVYDGLGHSLATPKGVMQMGWPPGYIDALVEWATSSVK